MVQAIFDDENSKTRLNWAYPDTGLWNPDRNTDDFCAALPLYFNHGLFGVTIGLQGGGPVYTPDIYDNYINSAFEWDGSPKKPYITRLKRILSTANKVGMIIIINFFYLQQNRRFINGSAIKNSVRFITEWLLESGYQNK